MLIILARQDQEATANTKGSEPMAKVEPRPPPLTVVTVSDGRPIFQCPSLRLLVDFVLTASRFLRDFWRACSEGTRPAY